LPISGGSDFHTVMSSLLAHIADRFLNTPLLLQPRKAAAIASVLGDRIGLDAGNVNALARSLPPMPKMERTPAAASSDYRRTDTGIAIIQIIGTLVARSSGVDAYSGILGYDAVKSAVKTAARDSAVTSILLDIHSPGGEAIGAFETADVIAAVAKQKPVVALVNGMAASAAYALAAAANRIVTTPSGISGSVGVVWLHVDQSIQLEKRGLTPTFLFAGSRKTVGNPLEPLDEQDTAEIQAEIDFFYGLFVDGVARHRPKLTKEALLATEARTYVGSEAVAAKLADAVGSFESVIGELGRLHGPATETPVGLTERLYGKLSAEHERLQAAHTAGVRAGMAAALAGRT
jgi:signal peptide peptidase SppA